MPQLDSSKAAAPPKAANEPRAGELNEQSPPPVTPDSANSLNSSSKAPPPPGTHKIQKHFDAHRLRTLEKRSAQLEGGAEEFKRELTKDGSACAREARGFSIGMERERASWPFLVVC